MRAAIRLLLALTLTGWGQFAFAAEYVWSARFDAFSRTGASPSAACSAALAAYNAAAANRSNSLVSVMPVSNNPASFTCKWADRNGYSGNDYTFGAFRSGDSCPPGGTYNSSTGECSAPKNCSAKPNIYAAVECTYIESAKIFSCPRAITNDGCEFVPFPDGRKNCDISTSICVNRYAPSGDESQPGDSECTETTCAPLPENPQEAPDNCVTGGGSTYCFEDQESGCGTFNGQQGCFETDEGCGTFNGTWGCYGTDKDTRNCGYANGERVCFNPNNPTQQIPSNSPDHPNNGGNADGNENNDPTAPGSTGGSSQGADGGATNESIGELGELLGPKIDKTNSLLDGISEKLDELTDGLLGDEYSDGQVGPGEGIKTDAEGFGEQLVQMITDEGEQVISEREEEAKTILETEIPKAISGPSGMFGESSVAAGALDLLNGVLPTASGCSDFSIDFSLDRYQADLVLPVCELTRLKPLLEYVIWIVTLIGLWKILYAGLRLEDAKASKGGF